MLLTNETWQKEETPGQLKLCTNLTQITMIFKVHSLLFTLMETSGKAQILSPFLGAEHFHFRFNNIKLPTLEFTSSVSVAGGGFLFQGC